MAAVKKGNIRERTTGKWEITIDTGAVDSNGKRIRKYEKVLGTRADAEKRLRALLVDLDAGQLSTTKLTVSGWLSEWMRGTIIPHRRQRTAERYQRIIDQQINPTLGKIQIAKLKPVDVKRMETRLLETLHPNTVGTVHDVLNSAMKQAANLELIPRNPVALVQAPPRRKAEVHPPDVQTVRDMLALAREEKHRLYAAMHLTAFTGLRRGEAMGLEWHNVNLAEGFLMVAGSLVAADKGLLLETPKTEAGKRRVDLDAGTIAALIEHRRLQDETRDFMRESYVDRGRVFTGATGEWIHPDMLLRAVKSYGKRVGAANLTVHQLRHFHASVMLQNGTNITVVSKRLGHSTVSFTSNVYTHSLPGWQRQAADAFAEAMEAGHSVGRMSANVGNNPHSDREIAHSS